MTQQGNSDHSTSDSVVCGSVAVAPSLSGGASVSYIEAPLIVTVRHVMPLTGAPVTTKFGRWLNDRRAIESQWLVKQNNGYVTNVFRAVVDDFGMLVPTLQLGGYIANVAPALRSQSMYQQWVA